MMYSGSYLEVSVLVDATSRQTGHLSNGGNVNVWIGEQVQVHRAPSCHTALTQFGVVIVLRGQHGLLFVCAQQLAVIPVLKLAGSLRCGQWGVEEYQLAGHVGRLQGIQSGLDDRPQDDFCFTALSKDLRDLGEEAVERERKRESNNMEWMRGWGEG